ncbi:hypothetical protein D9611_013224 [Ephemerocybe angulata]|uniref:F-box domain-containing protein n=1 Tax=Ephemerocybe angulata TaxID=980116 RepID=A0A8H5BU21_9AGAR|nr:hypothetical protein D9611_013224 [Tulosesus angulatus]
MNHHQQLPHLPFELWLRIFDNACQDDGTTSRSLSETNRYLREVSRFHRYHSVVVTGWRQLLAFEEHMSSVPEELRGIRNLYVDIEELYSVAYPPESWGPEVQDPDLDAGPRPPDLDWGRALTSGDEGDGGDSEYESESESDDGSDAWSGVATYEHAELSDGEEEDLVLDLAALLEEKAQEEDSPKQTIITGQDLSHLGSTNTPLAQLEFKVYSALRRLLESTGHWMRILTLCWVPFSSFHLEAILPSLPKLKYLAMVKGTLDNYNPPWNMARCSATLEKATPTPILFPMLEELHMHGPGQNWDGDDTFHGLFSSSLRIISAPLVTIECLPELPKSVEVVNVAISNIETPDWCPYHGEVIPVDDVRLHLYPNTPPNWYNMVNAEDHVYRRAHLPDDEKLGYKDAWLWLVLGLDSESDEESIGADSN